MKVGSAGHQELQFARQRHVLRHQGGVVVRVKGLNRVEPRVSQGSDAGREPEFSRMRQRGDATGLVNNVDDRSRLRSRARHKCRTPSAKPAIERLSGVRDVPRIDHGARNLGTANGAPVLRAGLGYQRAHINRHIQRRKPFADGGHPRDSRAALRRQERPERLVQRVKEIPEDMDVPAGIYRGDFNTAHRVDVSCGGEVLHLRY